MTLPNTLFHDDNPALLRDRSCNALQVILPATLRR